MAERQELTDSDLQDIYYFYEEDSLNRLSGWDEMKPLLEKEYPKLYKALINLEKAEKKVAKHMERMATR